MIFDHLAGTPISYFNKIDASPLDGLIGNSAAMRNVYQLTRLSAQASSSVLLLGETGTGKELSLIHI